MKNLKMAKPGGDEIGNAKAVRISKSIQVSPRARKEFCKIRTVGDAPEIVSKKMDTALSRRHPRDACVVTNLKPDKNEGCDDGDSLNDVGYECDLFQIHRKVLPLRNGLAKAIWVGNSRLFSRAGARSQNKIKGKRRGDARQEAQ